MKQISPISPIIPRGTAGFTGPLSLLRSRGTARALRALGGGGGRYKCRMDIQFIDSWEISLGDSKGNPFGGILLEMILVGSHPPSAGQKCRR